MKPISSERKAAYYVGLALIVVGMLVFASTFVLIACSAGDPLSSRSDDVLVPFFGCALTGMGLMIAGSWIRAIGARGPAGSGLVLDPARAREDLEPYSRMAGGMVKDALHEAGVARPSAEPEQVVKIRCRACGQLADETAKFCGQCGAKL